MDAHNIAIAYNWCFDMNWESVPGGTMVEFAIRIEGEISKKSIHQLRTNEPYIRCDFFNQSHQIIIVIFW
jgi:hypothetical protein